VFAPRSDAPFLLEALRAEPGLRGGRVLDLCTGSGVLALGAARDGAGEVVAVDLSRRAVLSTRLNARRHGLGVRAARGDLFAAVAGRRFDLIISNPPYLPAPSERLPRHRAAQAWDAGCDGRAILDRICARAREHLDPGGAVLIVQSSVCGERRTLELLRESGLEAETVRRRSGPLGPLLRARVDHLRAAGLLGCDELTEELLVIRGRYAGARSKASSPARWAPSVVTSTPQSAQAEPTQNAAG
jgi:release factor glutamine methyltransferase